MTPKPGQRTPAVIVSVAQLDDTDRGHRALGNAGLWWLGRLQTDADRERVVEGLGIKRPRRAGANRGLDADALLQKLAPRWFLVRNVHAKDEPMRLVQPRWAMTAVTEQLRGPMTGVELKRALGGGGERLGGAGRAWRGGAGRAILLAARRTMGLPPNISPRSRAGTIRPQLI